MTLLRRRPAFHQARAVAVAEASAAVPSWNLADLYAGMDAPSYAADLADAERDAERFATTYRGQLPSIAEGPDGGHV